MDFRESQKLLRYIYTSNDVYIDRISHDSNRGAAHCWSYCCKCFRIHSINSSIHDVVQDIVGVKRLLIIVIWVFITGNLIAGLSNSMELLVAGRLISGVGAAGIISLVIITISYLTNETQRSAYLNLINFVFILADSTGPIIGSSLAKAGQWRWLFLIVAPFGPISMSTITIQILAL
ncbi:major facilitator superfamily domain-containing protein [Flagelloscypha sp. PMI_526]|nr:major facilitator superfamily domain-containing protein [Flagelloscypha sp. PMI_526]